MAVIGIVAALGRELSQYRMLIQGEKQESIINGYRFLEFSYGNHRIVLASASVGKINAAICTQILCSQFNPDYVINSGSAGSLSKGVETGDVVVATESACHDVEESIRLGCFPGVSGFLPSPLLLEVAKAVALQYGKGRTEEGNIHFGCILTGDAFIACPLAKTELGESKQALAVEMEGAAVAHAAYVNQVPFLAVRGVSDALVNNAREEYQANERLAADRAAALVISMLEMLT